MVDNVTFLRNIDASADRALKMIRDPHKVYTDAAIALSRIAQDLKDLADALNNGGFEDSALVLNLGVMNITDAGNALLRGIKELRR
jgi:hypothetical protein